jgi:hypothetical protein
LSSVSNRFLSLFLLLMSSLAGLASTCLGAAARRISCRIYPTGRAR